MITAAVSVCASTKRRPAWAAAPTTSRFGPPPGRPKTILVPASASAVTIAAAPAGAPWPFWVTRDLRGRLRPFFGHLAPLVKDGYLAMPVLSRAGRSTPAKAGGRPAKTAGRPASMASIRCGRPRLTASIAISGGGDGGDHHERDRIPAGGRRVRLSAGQAAPGPGRAGAPPAPPARWPAALK